MPKHEYSKTFYNEVAEKIIHLQDSFPNVKVEEFARMLGVPVQIFSHLRSKRRFTHIADKYYDKLHTCATHFVITSTAIEDRRNPSHPIIHYIKDLKHKHSGGRGQKKSGNVANSSGHAYGGPFQTPKTYSDSKSESKMDLSAKSLGEIDDQIRRAINEEMNRIIPELKHTITEALKNAKLVLHVDLIPSLDDPENE